MKKFVKRVAALVAPVGLALVVAGGTLAIAGGATPDAAPQTVKAPAAQAEVDATQAGEVMLDQYQVGSQATSPFRIEDGTSVITALDQKAATTRLPARTQGFAATSCLTAAEGNSGRGFSVASADWRRGLLTLRFAKPLCAGVAAKGGGGQYAFALGAKTCQQVIGRACAGRPNQPLWPQLFATSTAWQALTRSTVTYRIPPVTNQCSQTDAAIWFSGGNGTWPKRLARPGVPQPRGVAYYVGNNRGCLPAPSVKVTASCITGCAGVGTLTYTACTTAPNAHTRFWLMIGGVKYRGFELTPQARCKTLAVRLADGTQYSFRYQIGLGTWGPETAIGGTRVIECPPLPEIQIVLNCPCAGAGPGLVNVKNKGSYTVVAWATVNRTAAKAITVGPKGTGTLALGAVPKSATVVIYARSYRNSVPKGPNVKLRGLVLS